MQNKQAVLKQSINNAINVPISQLKREKRENKDLQARLECQEINLLAPGKSSHLWHP